MQFPRFFASKKTNFC